MNLIVLAGVYITAFMAVDLMVEDPIRHYNFCVFLCLCLFLKKTVYPYNEISALST